MRTCIGHLLYSCPFAPSVGERRKQSVIAVVDNIILVCPFLLSRPCVACKETLFPTKLAVCDCGSPRALWRLRFMTPPFPSHSSGGISHHPSSHTNESGHVSSNSWWQKWDVTSQYSAHFHKGLLCNGCGNLCFGKGVNVQFYSNFGEMMAPGKSSLISNCLHIKSTCLLYFSLLWS